MSPDEFEDILFKSRAQDLRVAFSGLDEKARKSLSKTAQTAYSSLSRNKAVKGASERIRKFVEKRKGDSWQLWDAPINARAGLALYAVAPLSGVKRQNLWIIGGAKREAMFGILEDRRPDWLGDWVQWKLEQEFHHLEFERIYKWIKDGLMAKPDTPEYYSFFVTSVDQYLPKNNRHGLQPNDYVPLSTRLRRDPIWLGDALAVFKYENGALATDRWRTENAHPKYQSWSAALLDLIETGDLDRDTVLDASLKSLSEDLKNNQLSGNHKFHSLMKPNLEELAAREKSYRELLTHPVGHVVKFALAQISALEKAERADREALLSELPIVFQGGGKGNAKTALRLAGQIAKSDAKLRPSVLSSILPALDHEDADLQETALKLLTQYKDVITAEQKGEIERAMDFMAASLKPQAGELIGVDPKTDISEAPEEDLTTILEEVEALSHGLRENYGFDGLMQNMAFAPSLISQNFKDLRVLHLSNPLTPIQTHDDLYNAIAKALETVETASDVELIIDGISRLGRNTAPNFLQRLDPLLKRVKSGGTETGRGLTRTWDALGYSVIDLIQAWITGKIAKRNFSGPYYPHNKAAQPMIAHLHAVANRVCKQNPQNRMCTPTHENGWIDPRVWAERAKALSGSGQKSDVPDICYSMMRLAPDFRDEAAQTVDDLPQPWRAVARFLFGLDTHPDLSVKTHPTVWICAARARDPFADWTDVLSGLRLTETAPDGLRPAEYAWNSVTTEEKPTWSRLPIKMTKYTVTATPVQSARASEHRPTKTSFLKRLKPKTLLSSSAIPTACLATNLDANRWNGGAAGWLFEWMTLFWPQNPNAVYARATYAFSLDENASSWSTGHGYLHALFQANRPWRETGHLLIARGLATKNADIRGYIIDAVIDGSERGQFDPHLLASILEKMIQTDDVKLGRVAEGLTRIAEVSPLHAALVSISLTGLLPKVDRKTHALSTMMELWLETLAASGRVASEEALSWLSGFKGASKSTKAAKKIAALAFNASLDSAVRAHALQARLNVLP